MCVNFILFVFVVDKSDNAFMRETTKNIRASTCDCERDYCNSLHINLPKGATGRIQRIMRAAADVVSESKKFLNWLQLLNVQNSKLLSQSCIHISTSCLLNTYKNSLYHITQSPITLCSIAALHRLKVPCEIRITCF